MQLTDILGWVANIGFILGSFLIARKKVSGFAYFGIANGIYIWLGVLFKSSSIVAISVYLLAMNVYGIINWRKTQKENIK